MFKKKKLCSQTYIIVCWFQIRSNIFLNLINLNVGLFYFLGLKSRFDFFGSTEWFKFFHPNYQIKKKNQSLFLYKK